MGLFFEDVLMCDLIEGRGGIVGVGVDSIEIPRIAVALSRYGERFAARVLTEPELQEWHRRGRSVSFVAGRWAVKEAVAKALGCGIGASVGWRQVEVLPGGAGQPNVVLVGAARDFSMRQGVHKIFVSVTHSRTLATAAAVAVG